MRRFLNQSFRFTVLILAGTLPLPGVTNFISDQLPPGESLASLGLGERPFGPPERAVRLVEWSSVPSGEYCQQMAWWGDKIYCVLKEGKILEYSLDGTQSAQPFLDVAAQLGPDFIANPGSSFSEGIRGFAFHPGYDSNGLVYTMHRAEGTASPDLGFPTDLAREFILAEWDMNDLTGGNPTFREVLRIGFRDGVHRANHIGFNPRAQPGDPDYGKLYCGLGDNSEDHSTSTTFDSHDVGQDFTTVLASVMRIDPLDPSGFTDPQLTAQGLKRSANGKYAIPLDNPFAGHPSFAEEIFAKGFRNPLTMNFAPDGRAMVGDVGQLSLEEINLLENGGNYGWGLREGTFIFTMSDQTTGDFTGSDDSLRWVPAGDFADSAVSYFVRDKDGGNLRTETIARSGPHADGLIYPVAQFSHEGNNTNGTPSGASAVAAGQFYDGFWAEELSGLYLFANFSMDTLFYIETSALVNDNQPAEVLRLPLIDQHGNPTTLASITGVSRVNMRFGRDGWGNVYLVSKTNKKIYRFQGTPEMKLEVEMSSSADTASALVSLTRPGPDPTMAYTLMGSPDPGNLSPLSGSDFTVLPTLSHGNGTETARFQFLPTRATVPRSFFSVEASRVSPP